MKQKQLVPYGAIKKNTNKSMHINLFIIRGK